MRTCYFGAAGVCSKIDNLMLVDVSDSDWLMDVQWISAIAVEVEWTTAEEIEQWGLGDDFPFTA